MSSQHKGSPYKFDVVAVNVRCRDREQRLWCAVLAIDCAIVVVEIHGVQRRGCMFASVVIIHWQLRLQLQYRASIVGDWTSVVTCYGKEKSRN